MKPSLEQLSLPMTSAYTVQFRSLGNICIQLQHPKFSFSRHEIRPVGDKVEIRFTLFRISVHLAQTLNWCSHSPEPHNKQAGGYH